MIKIPMTLEGLNKIKKELKYLKQIKRAEIIKNISEARKYGDLKENAEYQSAKEQQGLCESKIKMLEYKLSNAQIIDIKKIFPSKRIIFGATIKLKNLNNYNEYIYRIVGDDESDFKKNLISVNSPIARGLIGKMEGERALIKTPKGIVEYEILQVQYI